MSSANADSTDEGDNARKLQGYTWLGVFIVCIIIDQFWSQYILTQTDWCKPLFLSMYVNLFSVIFIIKAFYNRAKSKSAERKRLKNGVQALKLPKVNPGRELLNERYSFYFCFLMGAKTSPLYVLDLAFYATSLIHLTVPTTELVMSTSVVVAFVVGIILKREKFDCTSTLSVCAMLGFAIVIYLAKPTNVEDGSEADHPIGYALALGSAICFGTLSVLMNYVSDPHMIGADTIDEDAVFGGQAIGGFILTIPILGLAHITGLEEFTLPSQSVLLQLTLLGALIATTCIYSFGKASMKLSPVVVQMSAVVCGPLTTLIDQIRGGHEYPAAYLWGMAGMIVFCFAASVVMERSRNATIDRNRSNLLNETSTLNELEKYPIKIETQESRGAFKPKNASRRVSEISAKKPSLEGGARTPLLLPVVSK